MARLGHVRLRRQQVNTARHVRQQMTTTQVIYAVMRATLRVRNNNEVHKYNNEDPKKYKMRATEQKPLFRSSPRSLLSSICNASSGGLSSPSWIVVKDPTSGETYNNNNGAIQWMLPVGPAAQG